MSIAQRLTEKIEQLSEDGQKEALAFVEFLLKKHYDKELQKENADWNNFSLEQAMRGIENDDLPEYAESDLKENRA